MENGEAVNEESALSVEEEMLQAIEGLEQVDVTEESSTSATDGETVEDSGSDTEEVEAREEQKEELIAKSSFTRRINGLQASRRKAEARAMDLEKRLAENEALLGDCLLYTSPSPRDATLSRMPSSA